MAANDEEEESRLTDINQLSYDAVILPADKSLLDKLGGVDINKILSPEIIKKAETAIADASEDLYRECLAESAKLASAAEQLGKSGNSVDRIRKIVPLAFGIKSKAAQSGYDLVAALAKSLHILCEEMTPEHATPAAFKIIVWHAQSIAHLLASKVKGGGGETGKAILDEIERTKLAAPSSI